MTTKLAIGGSPRHSPVDIDLDAMGVDFALFQRGWNTVPTNALDQDGTPKWPATLSTTFIRQQFDISPTAANGRILCWDIEGKRVSGLQAGDGAAYQRDLNWIDSIPAATRKAFTGCIQWFFNAYGWPNSGATDRSRDQARVAAGRALNDVDDGAGMCGYCPYELSNAPFDAWWSVHGRTVREWIKSGCVAYKNAHVFCSPEPETILFITGFCGFDPRNNPAHTLVPDNVLLEMIRAGIEGGANRICYWNGMSYLKNVPWNSKAMIAEDRRVLGVMKEAVA